jgi:inorganic pyrophosphatase
MAPPSRRRIQDVDRVRRVRHARRARGGGGLGVVPAIPRRGRLNAIVETPRGSQNKFSFDPGHRVFRLGKQLPAGAVFPFDFGFVPGTLADDGDPLDVLVLLTAPTFPGCLVRTRLLGVIEGIQTGRSGRRVSNPRLIAVATKASEHRRVRRLRDLPEPLLEEIAHFFVSYNAASGKRYEPSTRGGRRRAWQLVEAALRRHDRPVRR